MLTSLALIFLVGMGLGWLSGRLRLPALVGMIFTGMLLGPYALDLLDGSLLSISADLRQLALVIILTRAGLSLDLGDLKRAGRPAVLLCFVPACFEIAGRCCWLRRCWGSAIWKPPSSVRSSRRCPRRSSCRGCCALWRRATAKTTASPR